MHIVQTNIFEFASLLRHAAAAAATAACDHAHWLPGHFTILFRVRHPAYRIVVTSCTRLLSYVSSASWRYAQDGHKIMVHISTSNRQLYFAIFIRHRHAWHLGHWRNPLAAMTNQLKVLFIVNWIAIAPQNNTTSSPSPTPVVVLLQRNDNVNHNWNYPCPTCHPSASVKWLLNFLLQHL